MRHSVAERLETGSSVAMDIVDLSGCSVFTTEVRARPLLCFERLVGSASPRLAAVGKCLISEPLSLRFFVSVVVLGLASVVLLLLFPTSYLPLVAEAPGLLLLFLSVGALNGPLVTVSFLDFDTWYVAWNSLVIMIFTTWSYARRGSAPFVLDFFSLLYWFSVCILLVLWDAIRPSLWRRPRVRMTVAALILANAVRVLVRERLRDDQYSSDEVCFLYCARLRALAMSGYFNIAIFAAKFFVSSLFAPELPIVLSLRVRRRFVDSQRQLLFAIVPPELLRVGTAIHSRSPVDLQSTLEVPMVPAPVERTYVFQNKAIGTYARGMIHGCLIWLCLIVIPVTDTLSWTMEPGVAVLNVLLTIYIVLVEATRVDAFIMRLLGREFEFYYVGGSMIA